MGGQANDQYPKSVKKKKKRWDSQKREIDQERAKQKRDKERTWEGGGDTTG